MSDELKSHLAGLGPERLAESLMELSQRSKDAHELVERMTASSKSNVQRYKSKLAALKRQKRFVDWREARPFVRELENMLEDLRAAGVDPETGVKLTADFFRCDGVVFERCDDSNGNIGDVFRFGARDLFVHYAAHCQDKAALVDIVIDLMGKDDYGIRDAVVDAAGEYLPPDSMRLLIERFWDMADRVPNPDDARHWHRQIESVARQSKDAPTFEKARRKSSRELSANAFIDIGRAYLESGDPKTALDWLTRAHTADRDELLLVAHRALGNEKDAATVAWRMFNGYRSKETLDTLLSIIGKERREEVIAGEVKTILETPDYSSSNAAFLLACGRTDESEAYVLNRRDKLNGEFYASLLPIAESFESSGRWVAATVIYRALLDSILRRAVSKYYHHGVRYLKKLDALDKKIADWQCVSPHTDYGSQLKETHARKSSFWQGYHGRRGNG